MISYHSGLSGQDTLEDVLWSLEDVLRLAVWVTCPSICTGVSLPIQDWWPCILAPCWVEGMGKLGGSQMHVVTPQGIQTEQGQNSLVIFSFPRDPTNIQILQAFVACHQFANLNLVQALR